ncbi:Brefeldin A-inhibited guanine nucleotide-exchange protein 3 [Halotydeus destructor]|nr:Brefeldin A-inhibited guanine nucleotide-exchange protein 3 [Halotydeus destructor]
MDKFLDQVFIAAGQLKQPTITEACCLAKELIADSDELLKNSINEMRSRCLRVIHLCLESSDLRLMALAIEGTQTLIRDEINWTIESDTESDQLANQVTSLLTEHFRSLDEKVKINALKILLEMCCTGIQYIDSNQLTMMVNICFLALECPSPAVALQSAATTVSSQCVECFVQHCLSQGQPFKLNLFPLIAGLCQRLNELRKDGLEPCSPAEIEKNQIKICFMLKSLNAFLACMNEGGDEDFQEFTWKTFCPLLINLISASREQTPLSGVNKNTSLDHVFGRGSEGSVTGQASDEEISLVFAIGCHLVRLVAFKKSMRPSLESLFHMLLLLPSLDCRQQALKSTETLFRNCDMVIALICYEKSDSKKSINFNLLKIDDKPVEVEQLNGNKNSDYENNESSSDESLGGEAKSSFNSSSLNIHEKLSEYLTKEKLEHDHLVNQYDSEETVARYERENSRKFIQELSKVLLNLLKTKTTFEVDEQLQIFASNFCKDVWIEQLEAGTSHQHTVIVNGDGVYFATILSLWLNLSLEKSGYYDNSHVNLMLSEDEFANRIQQSGLAVHLSKAWLSEVYQGIVSCDLLKTAGYVGQSCPLINLLIDLDGLGARCLGSQVLSDYKRLSNSINVTSLDGSQTSQKILVKKILEQFWSSIIIAIGCLFRNENDHSSEGLLVLLSDSDETRDWHEKRATLIKCLEALQVASSLCIKLQLQSRCNGILDLLTKSACPTELDSVPSLRKLSIHKRIKMHFPKRSFPLSLHTSQVLSMKAVLNSALEVGPHCNPCWTFVFRTCEYIIGLEQNFFTNGKSENKARRLLDTVLKGMRRQTSEAELEKHVSSFQRIPGIEVTDGDKALELLVTQCQDDPLSRSLLKGEQLDIAIQSLYLLVDKTFEDSIMKLNLNSLLGFLQGLCDASSHEIRLLRKEFQRDNTLSLKPILFTRLCQSIIRVGKSGRPLVHFLRSWAVVTPLLIEASCHQSDVISTTAISTIGDLITNVLSTHEELDHFYYNAELFKPFEVLIQLELCHTDIREMVISALCGFVEGFAQDIKSGWRTLFGALRGVRLPNMPDDECAADAYELEMDRVQQLRVILDILEAFYDVQNLTIFSNAAVDCLLCLFNFLRDPACDLVEDSILFEPHEHQLSPSEDNLVDECIVALNYLNQFHTLLKSMYTMPCCPMFSSTRRITARTEPKVVQVAETYSGHFKLAIETELNDFDKPSKILQVWFIMLDGLSNSILNCPKCHQLRTIEMVTSLMENLTEATDRQFSCYCLNHILLPLSQRWLVRITERIKLNSEQFQGHDIRRWLELQNFKHFIGLVSQLVIVNAKLTKDKEISEYSSGCNLLLTQCLVLYLQMLEPEQNDFIFTLGSSCFRSLMKEIVSTRASDLWSILCAAIKLYCEACLRSLNSITQHFSNKSVNFYDDLQLITVISKRETMASEARRLCELSRQVFSVDDTDTTDLPENLVEDEGRTYVFNLRDGKDDDEDEIAFSNLIRELVAHELFVRTVAEVFLPGSDCLSNVSEPTDRSRAVLLEMDVEIISQVLNVLESSFECLTQFDQRPGLKFLLQKVCRLRTLANLYKASSELFRVMFNLGFAAYRVHGARISEQMKNFFTRACDKYSDIIAQHDKDGFKFEEMAKQPMILIGCELPLHKQLGLKSLEIRKDVFEIINGTRSDQLCSPSSSSNSDAQYLAYKILPHHKIEQMTDEYKKMKKQHAPLPPEVEELLNRKRTLPKRYSSREASLESSSNGPLMKDKDAYMACWNPLFSAVLMLHHSQSDDEFKRLLHVFDTGVALLILYIPHAELRFAVQSWFLKLTEQVKK